MAITRPITTIGWHSCLRAPVRLLAVDAALVVPMSYCLAMNNPAAAIPPRVLEAYEAAEPAAIKKWLAKCDSAQGPIYRITWATGYEEGRLFVTAAGQRVGMNTRDDVGMHSETFDERQLSNCVTLLESAAS